MLFIKLSSQFKGEITELQVAQSFLSFGIQVCKPLVTDCRYDFIVDINHNLIRIQVKTCSLEKIEDGYISFVTRSTYINTQKTVSHPYTKEEIDYFATFFNNQCYVIPVEKGGVTRFRLRIAPTKNGQTKNINFAEDYTLEKFLASMGWNA